METLGVEGKNLNKSQEHVALRKVWQFTGGFYDCIKADNCLSRLFLDVYKQIRFSHVNSNVIKESAII